VNIKAVVYDARELSERIKKFLQDNEWYDPEDDTYRLTKDEIMDSLSDDEGHDEPDDPKDLLTDIPDSWWAESAFKGEQRKALEGLWRKDSFVEARWEF